MKTTEQKVPYTFRDLKEAVNRLSDEQLAHEVYVQQEEGTLRILELCTVEEDLYQNSFDPEDRGTLAELREMHGEDFNEADYEFMTAKGSPYLAEDF